MTKPSSCVVITQARDLDYSKDYVSLPHNYGRQEYFQREDVQAIFAAVNNNLDVLDARLNFSAQLKERKVIIKPNLVTVFHQLGMQDEDYPESTDPRVLDAVIAWLQRYTRNIVIVESSGRGFPTRAAFKIAGIDRLSDYRGVPLLALEEQPVERYLLPKAKVMREIVVPRIFGEVISHEAFYISLPKLKTNLYTGVTLGFKNAMGTIPYNLRQRNHNHDIDQKLVDMLHLFTPDLVIIDGIVGAEGNCPAPVEPVPSRVIISGNQTVETDRVATRLMGIDPASIRLLRIADNDGFADPNVQIIGEAEVTPFRQADPSLLGEWMKLNYPNVRVLIGHHKPNSPQIGVGQKIDASFLVDMENSCRGGCLATTRYAFEMIHYEGLKKDFELTLIIGAGANTVNGTSWFDREGKLWKMSEVAALPGKKIAIGTCAINLKVIVDRFVNGCMPYPNSPHQAIHLLTGTMCRVMSFKNRHLPLMLVATLKTCEARKTILKKGERIDIPLTHADQKYPIRELTPEEQQQEFVIEPFSPLTPQEVKDLCAQENRSVLATFNP